MATILYKDGEKALVDASRVQAMLSAGWSVTVDGPTTAKEEIDLNQSGKLDPTEIRAIAKEKGIKNWGNKRIATLLKELGYVDEED